MLPTSGAGSLWLKRSTSLNSSGEDCWIRLGDWLDLIICCVDVSESQDVTTEEEQIEVETGAAASSVVQLGNIPEVKDIVESSDCWEFSSPLLSNSKFQVMFVESQYTDHVVYEILFSLSMLHNLSKYFVRLSLSVSVYCDLINLTYQYIYTAISKILFYQTTSQTNVQTEKKLNVFG